MKTHYNLNVYNICFEKIKERINKNEDICKKINNRIYITYYNIKKQKKIIKSKYRNIEEFFDIIYRSCFIPIILNGDLLYKKKYFDGITPYILPFEPKIKLLYLELFGFDKINYLLSVKNEKTNIHRILSGLLDIHLFFIKKCNTQMCSYVNKWSLYNIFYTQFIKKNIELLIVYILYFSYYLNKYIPNKNIIFILLTKIIKEIYIILINYYCF